MDEFHQWTDDTHLRIAWIVNEQNDNFLINEIKICKIEIHVIFIKKRFKENSTN